MVEKGLAKSRSKAKEYIDAGRVFVNGVLVTKAGAQAEEGDTLTLTETEKYVSRAGKKLERALEVFGISPKGLSVLDLGASTGGFTDCLLQNGALRVIALDVGRDQLDASLREDPRVTVMEGVNAREIDKSDLPFQPQMVTADLSFISQTLIYPAVSRVLTEGYFISLIKPQFEVGRENVGKGGIVKDADGRLLLRLLEKLKASAENYGLYLVKTAPSPIKGGDGNTEYLALFERRA